MSEYFFEYTCISCDSTKPRGGEGDLYQDKKFAIYQNYEGNGELCVQVILDIPDEYCGVRLYHIENGIDVPKRIDRGIFHRTSLISKDEIKRRGGFRITGNMLSGVGIFALVRSESEIPTPENTYTYSINFGLKQEIVYAITPKKKEIVIDIAYPLLRQDIELQVFSEQGGKPLTKKYRETSTINPITLKAGMKNFLHVRRKAEDTERCDFRLFFKNPENAKRYLLIDQSVAKEKEERKIEQTVIENGEIVVKAKKSTGRYYTDIGKDKPKTCPYCFNPLKLPEDYNKGYSYKLCLCSNVNENGEITNGKQFELKKNQKLQKEMGSNRYIICCGNEYREDSDLMEKDPLYKNLVIPHDYISKPSMNVAIVGYTNAGKSVMLSTLLDAKSLLNEQLVKDQTTSHDQKMRDAKKTVEANLLSKLVAKYDRAKTDAGVRYVELTQVVEENKNSTEFLVIDESNLENLTLNTNAGSNKIQELIQKNYRVEVGLPLPEHTTVKEMKDLSFYPFNFKMGNLGYSFFYDIPGELFTTTAEGNSALRSVRNADCLILIINGYDKNHLGDSIKEVSNGLETAKRIMGEEKLRNTPIAVVLAKFDMLQKEFDENCHILRENILDLIDQDRKLNKNVKYKDSSVSRHIEYSSYEIEHYLMTHGQANFVESMKKFTYMRYFAASALGSDDCYTHDSEKILLHEERPLREELPIIWLMYQMGLIKE